MGGSKIKPFPGLFITPRVGALSQHMTGHCPSAIPSSLPDHTARGYYEASRLSIPPGILFCTVGRGSAVAAATVDGALRASSTIAWKFSTDEDRAPRFLDEGEVTSQLR
jgi:hypothetical protein